MKISAREVVILALIASSPLIVWQISSLALGTPYPVLVVVSDSMTPSLNKGDLVFIQKVDASQITKGMIVAFESPKPQEAVYYIHRVVKVEGSDEIVFITKGDANEYPDSWLISGETIIGRLVGKIPYLGYAMFVPRTYFATFAVTALAADLAYLFYKKMTKHT